MFNNIKIISSIFVFSLLVISCGEDNASSPGQESGQEKADADVMGETAEDTLDAVKDKTKEISREAGEQVDQAAESNGDAAGQFAETTEELVSELQEGAAAATAAAKPQTHVINAEARVFNPDIIHIQPVDTVRWTNMTSHNSVSVEGLIPEGAEHWRGKLGENLKVTLNVEGVYAYVCEPHIGFGMVGVIVAGKPANLETVKKYAQENLEGPYRRIIGKLIKVKM